MANRKIQFANREIYHIVMRGIDGINLFRNNQDYFRMVHDIFEFNDVAPALSAFRVSCYRGENVTKSDLVTDDQEKKRKKRKLLVEIQAFCLMPNHVHLLVRQLQENGISKFMQKFGGYALYYNNKYKRKGHLFQDRFQAVYIKSSEQLMTAFVYIHTNPVAIIFPGWKEKGITDPKKAIKFVEDYKWSSYQDYLGKKNLPSLTSREFLREVVGEPKTCQKFVNSWLQFKGELSEFDYVAIE